AHRRHGPGRAARDRGRRRRAPRRRAATGGDLMDFTLTESQRQAQTMLHALAEGVLRPMSLEVDRAKRWPDEILERLAYMRDASPGADIPEEYGGEGAARRGPKQTHRFTMVGSEELAWGDASILLCLPGPGLGGPPLRFMGTDEQRRRFFGIFK